MAAMTANGTGSIILHARLLRESVLVGVVAGKAAVELSVVTMFFSLQAPRSQSCVALPDPGRPDAAPTFPMIQIIGRSFANR
jgi:hypothetical protein